MDLVLGTIAISIQRMTNQHAHGGTLKCLVKSIFLCFLWRALAQIQAGSITPLFLFPISYSYFY
jgi:hypothetical protein